MRLVICLFAACLLAVPATAQTSDIEQKDQTQGDGGKSRTDDMPGAKPGGKGMKDASPDAKPADGAGPTAPITGVWQVVGSNAAGQTYRGAVAVRQVGEVYRVVWRIGQSTYWGVGILSGRIFSVAYQSGLAVYRVTPNGLVGRWTTFRGTNLQNEHWRRK